MNHSPTLITLIYLGFKEAEPVYGMPTVKCKLNDLVLTCSQGMNRYSQQVVFVSGIRNTVRKLEEINSEFPVNLQDPCAVSAWLAYVLRGKVGGTAGDLPAWFKIGLENQDLVPMVAVAKAYATRPHCTVERDFARILRTRLAVFLKECSAACPVELAFDGVLLSVRSNEFSIDVPASGSTWEGRVIVELGPLVKLPQRFISRLVEVGFLDDQLRFDRYRYAARWLGRASQ